MELNEQYIEPSSKFMKDYITKTEQASSYFDHLPDTGAFAARLRTLKEHPADRKRLTAVVRAYMEPFGLSGKAEQNLAALSEGAPVVVAGQQAGLFTGPLYTVHKAISAIVLAREAAEKLEQPVVPVFWIAGEDHDLAEIAHVYRDVNGRVDKLNFPHAEYGKHTASSARMNKARLGAHISEYFRSLPETAYSRELFSQLEKLFGQSETFTDFFARLLNHFFSAEGLLFIDAADAGLRRHEADYFRQLIEQTETIAESVYETEQRLVRDGYTAVIGAKPEAAHLFITVAGERFLLERDGDRFTANDGAFVYTKAELLAIAETEPEILSNNVVTRPLMQEMVFPVLAFVGGPGEIAYWAALKGAFRAAGLEMPVVMPRLFMTLVTRQAEALLRKYEVSAEEVIAGGKIDELRRQFEEAIREERAEELIGEAEESFKASYRAVEEELCRISQGLKPVVEKNLAIHLRQFDYLRRKLEEELLLRHESRFRDYQLLENELNPAGSYQERIFTPVPYLNTYGPDLVKDLLKLPFKYNENHKIIYL